ncbi:MAG: hypothetical protein HY342_10910 [Candidatus Lambdaproteobacteria bacterium]|nr:hypothetical protein [Candidatus Lambdaproteobacteria bacterium]
MVRAGQWKGQRLAVATLAAGLLALSPAAAAAQTAPAQAATAKSVTATDAARPMPAAQAPAAPAGAPGKAQAEARAPLNAEDLQRLRTLLLSVDGFDRRELDALGGDVAGALKSLAADQGGDALLRRQAIKALGLYPTDDTFAFLSARLDTPEPQEKRLVLTVLGAFGARKPEQVRQLVQTHLADPNLSVRYAALGLSSHLPRTPETWNLLRARLPQEQDAALRRAIERRLPDLKPAQ